jgi:CheY-specific phosphatase CheX
METARAARLIENATLEVFSTMLATELGVEPAFRDPEPFQQSDVMGLIGFAGAARGYVSLHCSRDLAAHFTGRLLGLDGTEVESMDDIRDAVGEVVNMIAGTLKAALGSEEPIEIALPTVVLTPKPDIRVRGQTGVVVPFMDPEGSFHVELVLDTLAS